jgi:D-glycero-D-manno-heptose 1,7-bisphosphate phosphatase
MNRAVFLDRDGTVTEEVGYLTSLDMLKPIRGAGAAIKRLNEAEFKVVLVTNQSGVARGYFPESLVDDAHILLRRMLMVDGALLDGIYYCPHHPTAGQEKYTIVCDCRKPETGLLDRAAKDLAIDLKQSFMIGDKWSDIELGHRAGMRSILVRTGFSPDDPGNKRPAHVGDPDLTARDLAEAVQWIIGQKATDRP